MGSFRINADSPNTSNATKTQDNRISRNSGYSVKQKAARKIIDYFSSLNNNKMRECLPTRNRASLGFLDTDIEEPGKYEGDEKLTAKTWNGILKKLGISNFRIKESISLNEFNAFMKKYGVE